jgi:hypothetical protein
VPVSNDDPRPERAVGHCGSGERALEPTTTGRAGGLSAGQPDGAGGHGAPSNRTDSRAGPDVADGAPKAAIDSGSAERLLASLASVPVSGLKKAFGLAGTALASIQGREKAAAQAAIPAIDQPTGLPAVAAPKAVKPTDLPQGQPPELQPATGRAGPLPEPKHPEPTGPLPGSQVSIVAAEPAAQDDGGGSWWSWLTDRLRGFFGSLPTTDPKVSTSAGPRQRVDLTGEADPAQSAHQQQASG